MSFLQPKAVLFLKGKEYYKQDESQSIVPHLKQIYCGIEDQVLAKVLISGKAIHL